MRDSARIPAETPATHASLPRRGRFHREVTECQVACESNPPVPAQCTHTVCTRKEVDTFRIQANSLHIGGSMKAAERCFSRRDFLKTLGVGTAGITLSR